MSRASPDIPSSTSTSTFYPIKWILDSSDRSIPIIMQSDNGPCPLLSLANISLQTRLFTITPGTTRIREDHLMSMLADFISNIPPSSTSPSSQLRENAVADFLDVLPNLSAGMNVNVRFSSPTAFEFTKEVAVFDIFPNVRLLHGWLVDPQDARLAATLGHLSYNQLQLELVRTDPQLGLPDNPQDPTLVHIPSAPPLEEFDQPYIEQPSPPESQPVEESLHTAAIRELRPMVVDFLESNPTMLTIYGLTELHRTIRESECAILFRNSHFYVIRKHCAELFTLVTDVGYLNELNTVWEKLADITGDSIFYNAAYQPLDARGGVQGANPSTGGGTQRNNIAQAPGPIPYQQGSGNSGGPQQWNGIQGQTQTHRHRHPQTHPHPHPQQRHGRGGKSGKSAGEKCVVQ